MNMHFNSFSLISLDLEQTSENYELNVMTRRVINHRKSTNSCLIIFPVPFRKYVLYKFQKAQPKNTC